MMIKRYITIFIAYLGFKNDAMQQKIEFFK